MVGDLQERFNDADAYFGQLFSHIYSFLEACADCAFLSPTRLSLTMQDGGTIVVSYLLPRLLGQERPALLTITPIYPLLLTVFNVSAMRYVIHSSNVS